MALPEQTARHQLQSDRMLLIEQGAEARGLSVADYLKMLVLLDVVQALMGANVRQDRSQSE